MLVVARASNPRCASSLAVPGFHGLGMMNAPSRSCNARNDCPFSACVDIVAITLSSMGWRDSERSIHHLHEVSFFVENEPLALRHGEVLPPFGIRLYAGSVRFISGQALKCYQTPADIIGPFVGKKVSHEVAAAPRNDAAPILRIFLERVALKRIDLVADDADDRHLCSPRVGIDGQSPQACSEGRRARREEPQSFAAAHPPGC